MTLTRTTPVPVFTHLLALSDGHGLFEHAEHGVPRAEHGYCIDDEARAVVVLMREAVLEADAQALAQLLLTRVSGAITADGLCHNRHDHSGAWTDSPSLDDCWGRALWALGAAAAHAPAAPMRDQALRAFRRGARNRPVHPRPLAFAALGAGEVLAAHPEDPAARAILRSVADTVTAASWTPSWSWPSPRLTYANGSVAESVILAGHCLGDGRVLDLGLELLGFLLRSETRDGHLSVTPVGGRGAHDVGPGFDQQPIEVAALADACARAFAITGERRWRDGVELALAWFLGDNDSATPMVDLTSGAGYDGLEADGRNENCGAESTLAALSTLQQALRVGRR